MATEVELKAWVDNAEEVRLFLASHAEFSKSFVKDDTYFCLTEEGQEGKTRFRLRRQEEEAVVTYKERTREGGTEINREHEFTVSDPETFIYFAGAMGYSPCIRKRKVGELYRWGEVNVELSRVDELGWFIEIENLVDFRETGQSEKSQQPKSSEESELAEAKKEIYRILEQIGIARERVEHRYYVEMLRDARKEK